MFFPFLVDPEQTVLRLPSVWKVSLPTADLESTIVCNCSKPNMGSSRRLSRRTKLKCIGHFTTIVFHHILLNNSFWQLLLFFSLSSFANQCIIIIIVIIIIIIIIINNSSFAVSVTDAPEGLWWLQASVAWLSELLWRAFSCCWWAGWRILGTYSSSTIPNPSWLMLPKCSHGSFLAQGFKPIGIFLLSGFVISFSFFQSFSSFLTCSFFLSVVFQRLSVCQSSSLLSRLPVSAFSLEQIIFFPRYFIHLCPHYKANTDYMLHATCYAG